jgi:hypothetical protein
LTLPTPSKPDLAQKIQNIIVLTFLKKIEIIIF